MNVYAMNGGHFFHRIMEIIGLIVPLIYLICPVLIPGWYFNKVLQPVVHEIKYNGYAKIGLTLGKIMGAQIKNTVSQLDYFVTVSLIE